MDSGISLGTVARRRRTVGFMIVTHTNPSRDDAVARIKTKRAFQLNLCVYAAVNLVFVVIWFATHAEGEPFWPIWPIALWGIGVALQAWHAYGPNRRPISDAEIAREMSGHG